MKHLFYASDSINCLLNLSNRMAHGYPKLDMSTVRFPSCTHPPDSFSYFHFNEGNCQMYAQPNQSQGFIRDSSSLPPFLSIVLPIRTLNPFLCSVPIATLSFNLD